MGDEDLGVSDDAPNPKDKYSLCNKKFWNNFFAPRYPGVHIILLFVLLNTVYTCIFVLMSTYFENFSHLQHSGYFTHLLANIVAIVTGFLSIYFLTLKPINITASYCIFIHVAMIIALFLGGMTFSLMLTEPSPDEILIHSKAYVYTYHRAPFMMRNVFKEKQCCGILKFGDIFKKDKQKLNGTHVIYYRVPPSCCRKQKNLTEHCEKWVEDPLEEQEFNAMKHEYLYMKPCLKKGDHFSSLRHTKAYKIYMKTVLGAVPIFPIIFGILLVLNYYIWYRFPRMPAHQRPIHFNEDIRLFVKCKCKRLHRNLEADKRRTSQQKEALYAALEGTKGVSEFHMRHNMIMQSLQNMRTLNRELRQQEQMGRQLEATKSAISLAASRQNIPTLSARDVVNE